MQVNPKNISESVFNPPGCNPFATPLCPPVHYFPSTFENHTPDIKNTALTPEKCRDFKIKGNDSYTPLNYSFLDESYDIPEKLVQEDSSRQEAETWPSSFLNERWPSQCRQLHTPSTVPSSADADASSVAVIKDKLLSSLSSAPEQPKMSSTQASQPSPIEQSTVLSSRSSSQTSRSSISRLMDRFRHGAPLPPKERKRLRTPVVAGKPPPSSENKSQEAKYEANLSKPDREPSEAEEDSSKSADDSFAELQRKVDQLLHESSSMRPSPSSVPSTQHSPMQLSSTVPTLLSSATRSELTISNVSSIPSNSPARLVSPPQQQQETPTLTDNCKPSPTSRYTVQLPTYTWKNSTKEAESARPSQVDVTKPALPFKDDILQQWRLRRKMEQAQISNNQYDSTWKNFFGETVKRPQTGTQVNHPPAERPLHQSSQYEDPHVAFQAHTLPRKEMRNVGISAVPTICAETQTSPRSSATPSPPPTAPVSSIQRRESVVSLERVKVVNGCAAAGRDSSVPTNSARDPISPSSVASSPKTCGSSGAWGSLSSSVQEDGGGDASVRHNKQSKVKGKSVPKRDKSSPTTTVVKKVVGSRLFDTSVTPDRTTASISDTASTIDQPTVTSSDALFMSGRPPAASSTAVISPGREAVESVVSESFDEPRSAYSEHVAPETYFREPTPPEKLEGVESEESQGLHTSVKSPSPPSDSSIVCEDPHAVLEQLLKNIENEEKDFLDDPVMTNLRQQRDKFLAELQYIDEELKKRKRIL